MQALLSDNWHSVRWIKPMLRDGVRVYHRVYRGRAAVLLFDPASHRFHRLSGEAWRVIELFDGQHTLEDIWEMAALSTPNQSIQTVPNVDLMKTGGLDQEVMYQDAIGQPELVQLVSQLHAGDLLQTQVTPDAAEVLERFERHRKAKLKQIFMNPLSLKLPLLYPEPWLKAQVSLAQRVFSLPMLWCWLCLVLPAAVLGTMHWNALTENLSDRILSGQNLMIAWFTYPVVKALHEWSHALAVKKWGGHVREAGLIFLMFIPVPYVDATDSYGFASKWQRATVAAAGVMAELMMGAIAMYVWVLVEPGMLRAVAYNVILIASVSTLMINGNPFMRYDGYFVLSEWLEIPNFAQRSTKYWAYLADRYLFNAVEAKSPAQSFGESRVFFIYGAIAPIYRLTIALGIAWFVAEEYFIFGVIIAIAGVWASVIKPVWNGWKHLRTSPTLAGHHGSAIKRSFFMVSMAAVIFFFLPLPFYAVSEAVLWVPEQAEVRAGAAGFVSTASAMVSSEAILNQGDVIAVLENPTLQAELELARGQVDELDAQLRKQESNDVAKTAGTRSQLKAALEKREDAERKATALVLRAADSGHWVFVNGSKPTGQYFKRGQTIGYVVNGPSKTLRVAVAQEDIDLVQTRTKGISVRLLRRPWAEYSARNIRRVAAGQQQLVSPALGSEGGGAIAVDPSQREATTALQRVFDFELELDRPDPLAAFGDRAKIRFNLGWSPLAEQLFLRLRQTFLTRLNL